MKPKFRIVYGLYGMGLLAINNKAKELIDNSQHNWLKTASFNIIGY